jgi:hypothetical protein
MRPRLELRGIPVAVKAAAAIFVLLPALGLAWSLAYAQMAFPVAALAYLAICAALAWNLLLRRNWARLALVAIVTLDLAQYHWSLEQFLAAYRAFPALALASLGLKLLAVAGAGMMFLPASNRWMSASSPGAA